LPQGTYSKSKLFNFENQQLVELLIELLGPFEKATTLLSGESASTLPLVLPTIKKLKQALTHTPILLPAEDDGGAQEETDSSKIVKRVKAAMKTDLTARVQTHRKMYELASILDPRTKNLPFLTPEERELVRERLSLELLTSFPDAIVPQIKKEQGEEPLRTEQDLPTLPTFDVIEQNQQIEIKQEAMEKPVLKKSRKKTDTEDWLEDIMIVGEERPEVALQPAQKIRLEMDRYFAEIAIGLREDPLTWWLEREGLFPCISRLARKYLSVPASSVPSERIFSLAGNIVSRKRASLKPENVDMFIFMKKNYYS